MKKIWKYLVTFRWIHGTWFTMCILLASGAALYAREAVTYSHLLLVYSHTDSAYMENGVEKHFTGNMGESLKTTVVNAFRNLPGLILDGSDQLVRSNYEIVDVPHALTSVSEVYGGLHWPSPYADINDDLSLYAPEGRYDSVHVLWYNGPIPTAWGWGGILINDERTTYSALIAGEESWWNGGDEAFGEPFLHEWLHGVCRFYGDIGYAMPENNADGATIHGYGQSPTEGYMQYYRDLMRGAVWEPDPRQFTGITREAWLKGTPNHFPGPFAEIVADPLSHDFGEVRVGSGSSVIVGVRNEGGAALALGSLTIEAANASDFAIVHDGASNRVLLPQGAIVTEWAVASGGNGHFYWPVAVPDGITWDEADALAREAGGYLATITSDLENAFVYALLADPKYWKNGSQGPWLGGYQAPGSAEPAGGWQWVTGEPSDHTCWCSGEPNNWGGNEGWIHFDRQSDCWNDNDDGKLVAYVVEFDGNPDHGPATVEVVFSPVTAGTKAASLAIPSNDPFAPVLDITVSGAGTLRRQTLKVAGAGAGRGRITSVPAGIDCGIDCSEPYDYGSTVTLAAIPDAGSSFAGWSGDLDCSDGNVTMTADRTCTAVLALAPVLPDLVIATIDGPATGRVGASISVKNTIRNTGAGATKAGEPIVVGFYLSRGTTAAASDSVLGARTIQGLQSGASSTANTVLRIPSTVPVGTYYITAVVDPGGKVAESNEGNNRAYDPQPITVRRH